MRGIQDTVAIVTGAASGIGRATAERFAEEGASVVAADVDAAGGEETVDGIREAGGEATFVEADVTDPEAVAALVEETEATYGPPDAAFNNAGVEGATAPTAEQSPENWNRVLDVNLRGVWECLRRELPVMVENGGGSVVNMSSVAGLSAAGSAPYAASKHGVVGLTRTAAVEYAGEGVRVNAVCPGVIDTPMVDRAAESAPEAVEQFVAGQPLGRMGDPEEVAGAVVYLCSDDASFVTGHPLVVDGGLLTH